VERELDEELASYIEMLTDEKVRAGIDSDAARREALIEAGGVTQVKEEVRAGRAGALLDSLMGDLRYTVRSLLRTPSFTALAVACLALGIGANAALFSFLDRVLFRPPPGVVEPEGVRRVFRHIFSRTSGEFFVMPTFDYLEYSQLRPMLPSGVQSVVYYDDAATLGRGERAPKTRAVWFDTDYFDLLGVRTAIGRLPGDDEMRADGRAHVALISHSEWMGRYDGDPAVLGRTIEVGFVRYTVIGVLAPGFHGVDVRPSHYWLPLGIDNEVRGRPWYKDVNLAGLELLIRPGTHDDERIASIVTAASRRGHPARPERPDTTTRGLTGPLLEALGPVQQSTGNRIAVRLAGVAGFVLLIACANVANLLLARTVGRRREIAVRLALGISRARLVSLMVTESLVVALMAGTASLAIAAWAGHGLRSMLMPDTPWPGGVLDLRIALFALGVGLLVGLLVGVLPALRASQFSVSETLKHGARGGAWRRSNSRSALLIVQAGFSVMLLVGAGAFIKSLQSALRVTTGWDIDQLVTVAIRYEDGDPHDDDREALIPRVMERLRTAEGVEAVALSGATPMRGPWMGIGMAMPDGSKLPDGTWGNLAAVSPGYFAVTGLRLIGGRDFSDDDRYGAERVIIVNELMARGIWPGENALGKCLLMLGSCARVVGVVEQAHLADLIERAPEPQYFVPIAQFPAGNAVAIARMPGKVLAPDVERLRSAVRPLLPTAAYPEVLPVSEYLLDDIRPWQLGATLFSVFGILALLVAAVGIYSSISYAVNEGLRELGIRAALGAAPARLVRMVVGSGVRVVAIGVLIGLILATQFGRVLQSLLYETTPHDPEIMLVAAAVLVAVAATASLVPAWRASRVDPIEVLRSE
jgi:predicted permease